MNLKNKNLSRLSRVVAAGLVLGAVAVSQSGCAGLLGSGATATPVTTASLTGGAVVATGGGSKVLATTGQVLGGIVTVGQDITKIAPIVTGIAGAFLGDLQGLTGNTASLVLAPVAAPPLAPGAPVAH